MLKPNAAHCNVRWRVDMIVNGGFIRGSWLQHMTNDCQSVAVKSERARVRYGTLAMFPRPRTIQSGIGCMLESRSSTRTYKAAGLDAPEAPLKFLRYLHVFLRFLGSQTAFKSPFS